MNVNAISSIKHAGVNTRIMPKLNRQDIDKRFAFHAAGYAASIVMGNKQKGLPPVFFQIVKKPLKSELPFPYYLGGRDNSKVAKIEGGRFFLSLPLLLLDVDAGGDFAEDPTMLYEKAFEADVANILAGPLAEAKYVALSDDEVISPRLVNLNALAFYNGTANVDLVLQYFEGINKPADKKESKIIDIYINTFGFICEYHNWTAITRLAEHILASEKQVIGSDEVTRVLEPSLQ